MDKLNGSAATVAAGGAAVVALSIIVAVIVGELPDTLWFLLVPVGMLGGGLVCMGSLAVLLARRVARADQP